MPTEQIADLLEEVRRVRRQLARPNVTEGSQADIDFVVCERDRGTRASAEGVIALVDLWTLIAAEQLASIAALLRAEEYVYGFFPLARSVIEHSTAVVWLLDLSIAPHERAARGALAIDRSNESLVTTAAHLSDKQNETYKARRAAMRAHRAAVNEEFQHTTPIWAVHRKLLPVSPYCRQLILLSTSPTSRRRTSESGKGSTTTSVQLRIIHRSRPSNSSGRPLRENTNSAFRMNSLNGSFVPFSQVTCKDLRAMPPTAAGINPPYKSFASEL